MLHIHLSIISWAAVHMRTRTHTGTRTRAHAHTHARPRTHTALSYVTEGNYFTFFQMPRKVDGQ